MASEKIGSAPNGTKTSGWTGSELFPITGSQAVKLPAHSKGPVIQSLTMAGIASDGSTPLLPYGAYPSTSGAGADQTAAIQTIINNLSSYATSVELIWDVAVATQGQGTPAPLLIPSNFTLRAPNPSCGAILRNGANCPMFTNSGAAPNDTSTSNQNTFGALDSAHSGNSAYRILSWLSIANSSVNFGANQNIAVIGGTWNGNGYNQTTGYFHPTYGLCHVFRFYGVSNLLIKDLTVFTPLGYHIHCTNTLYGWFENLNLDTTPKPAQGAGALQFEGPNRFLFIKNIAEFNDEDHLAFNADGWSAAAYNSNYGTSSASVGVNIPCAGDQTDIVIDGIHITPGAWNYSANSQGCIRLMSSVHTIDRFVCRKVSGINSGNWAFTIGAGGGANPSNSIISGNGNIGRLLFEDIDFDASQSGNLDGKGVFSLSGNIQYIGIRRARRLNPVSTGPFIWFGNSASGGTISPAGTLGELDVDLYVYDQASSANNAAPIIQIAGPVNYLRGRISQSRDSSQSTIAAPALQLESGAAIDIADLEVDINRTTNIVDFEGGTFGHLRLSGTFSRSGGGSPVNIVSGLTLTDAWYKDLAYNTSNNFNSGSGTITNTNSWSI